MKFLVSKFVVLLWEKEENCCCMNITGKKPFVVAIIMATIALCSCGNTDVSSSSSAFVPDSSAAKIPDTAFSEGDYLYHAKEGDSFKAIALEQATFVGDSVLYKYGDYEILVDGGMPALSDSLVSVLKKEVNDGVLELLILSHQHYDHFGSLSSSVFEAAGIKKVLTFIDNGVTSFNNDYKEIWVNGTKPYLMANGSTYHPIQDYFSGSLSPALPIAKDLTLVFLDSGYYPIKNRAGVYESNGNPNEESIGFVIYAKGYEFISLGDSLLTTEANYIKKYCDHPFRKEGDKAIFKASHHASWNANSSDFMAFIKPDYCFVTAAIEKNNSSSDGVAYVQEPLPDTRKRIEKYSSPDNFYWTATTGDLNISLSEDFTSVSFKGEGRKIGTYYGLHGLVDPNEEKDLPIEETAWAKTEKYAIGY